MSYEKTTIRNIIEEIDHNKIYLPALQRKFVWGKLQIQLLFDSLMRNYPIGTFLFWQLHRQNAENYVFYDFLKEYDERNPYNRRKTGAFSYEMIKGVLDGQQRLSSLYVGLMGTHRERLPHRRISDDTAYPKTSLYLNLLSLPYEIDENEKIGEVEDRNFEFKFLNEIDAVPHIRRITHKNEYGNQNQVEEPTYWLKLQNVLSWDIENIKCDELIDGFIEECKSNLHKTTFEKKRPIIKKGIETLHSRINKEELLNYFEIIRDDLEDILNIFIRVNSGGTPLDKTDLLFSTIVATWDDGREKIEELLKTINNKGDKFNFKNEYIMRCCLVLTDSPVLYKVKSFKSENVQKIRDAWPEISDAIIKTVDILVEFGFSSSFLTSQNSTIIIAYYIYKGGAINKSDKQDIQKYLIHALLSRIYGSQQDQLINTLRNAFREEIPSENGISKYQKRYSSFVFDEILKIELPGRKSLAITKAEIDRFLSYKKSTASFLILSLLYPNLRYGETQFHQDHIHPFAGFKDEIFDAIDVPIEERNEWLNLRDSVPNLQLLEGRLNKQKNDTQLSEWMENMTESKRVSFCENNYFPENIGMDFTDFIEFYTQRKEILRTELIKVLAITDDLLESNHGEIIEDEDFDVNNSFIIDEENNVEQILIETDTYPHNISLYSIEEEFKSFHTDFQKNFVIKDNYMYLPIGRSNLVIHYEWNLMLRPKAVEIALHFECKDMEKRKSWIDRISPHLEQINRDLDNEIIIVVKGVRMMLSTDKDAIYYAQQMKILIDHTWPLIKEHIQ